MASSAPVDVEQEQKEESKSLLETVHEIITAPIFAVTETVKEISTQLQLDQQDTSAITIEYEDLTVSSPQCFHIIDVESITIQNSTIDNQLAENDEQTTSTPLDTVTANISSSEQTYQPIIESTETPVN